MDLDIVQDKKVDTNEMSSVIQIKTDFSNIADLIL